MEVEDVVLKQYKLSIYIDLFASVLLAIFASPLFLLYPLISIAKYRDMKRAIRKIGLTPLTGQ